MELPVILRNACGGSKLIHAHINKCDTLCVFDDFSKEAVEERIHKLNPKAEVIFVSAKTGEGFESWAEWLRKEVKEWQK